MRKKTGKGLAIAAAWAVAVAGASVAWLIAAPGPEDPRAPGPQDRRPHGPTELELASGAIEFYEAKYAANHGHPTFGHRLIDFYALRFGWAADLHDLRRAEAIARELVGRARDASELGGARARLSSLLLAQHEFERALNAANAAVEADPTNPALGVLYDAAMAIGADRVADGALARMERGSVPWLVRASRVDLSEGRLEDALARMGRAYRELFRSPAPRQTVAWAATQLAEIEHQRSGPEAAARWHRRALEIAPGYRGALEGLADLARGRGEWREAESLYRRILAEAHPDLYLRLAEVRRAQGDAADARRWERRFLEVAARPEVEPLYARELALFYARNRAMYDRALEIAQREVARRPAAESWEMMTWVRIQGGEMREALALSDRIRRAEWREELAVSQRTRHAGGASPTADYHRACILEALGRGAEADVLYASALEEPTLLAPHALHDARSRGLLVH